MNTHNDAVEYLKARGLYASQRNWVLGENICAATGRIEGAIPAYRRVMYIVPRAGAWTSFELDRDRPDDDVEMSLSESCARVERILTNPSDHPRDTRR